MLRRSAYYQDTLEPVQSTVLSSKLRLKSQLTHLMHASCVTGSALRSLIENGIGTPFSLGYFQAFLDHLYYLIHSKYYVKISVKMHYLGNNDKKKKKPVLQMRYEINNVQAHSGGTRDSQTLSRLSRLPAHHHSQESQHCPTHTAK